MAGISAEKSTRGGMVEQVNRCLLRGRGEAGEGGLRSEALNFGPWKHTGLCTLKSQIVSRALKTLEPPMGRGEEARVFPPSMCVLFAFLSRAVRVRAGG